jgi:hypothetical protein
MGQPGQWTCSLTLYISSSVDRELHLGEVDDGPSLVGHGDGADSHVGGSVHDLADHAVPRPILPFFE